MDASLANNFRLVISKKKVIFINSPIASSSMLGVVISMVVVAVPVGPVNSTSKKLWVTVERRKNCYLLRFNP